MSRQIVRHGKPVIRIVIRKNPRIMKCCNKDRPEKFKVLLILLISCLSLINTSIVGEVNPACSAEPSLGLAAQQITFGPKHHFFGYIGHTKTIPWNKSGRYLLALQTDFQDHMPKPDEAAGIALLDAQNNYRPKQIEQTRAWNFQQGTMMCWNPLAEETQFFFNDRDPKTNEVFCVLFDISKGTNGERIAEYRYSDTPIGNCSVAHHGRWFLAANYGRLARLRAVTGYPEARDWTVGQIGQPTNDGIFKVDIATKEKQLLVSLKQLADALEKKYPKVQGQELFINYVLCNSDDSRFLFFARADFDNKEGKRVDGFFVVNSDGTGLKLVETRIGGHPEWVSNHEIIASQKGHIVFDLDEQMITSRFGTREIFPDSTGDVAFSADKKWFVNGYSDNDLNVYAVLRLADGAWGRSSGLSKQGYRSGNRRIDPAPAWNRDGTQMIGYGLCPKDKTRQVFLITISNAEGK
jgi:hypothetical protein